MGATAVRGFDALVATLVQCGSVAQRAPESVPGTLHSLPAPPPPRRTDSVRALEVLDFEPWGRCGFCDADHDEGQSCMWDLDSLELECAAHVREEDAPDSVTKLWLATNAQRGATPEYEPTQVSVGVYPGPRASEIRVRRS